MDSFSDRRFQMYSTYRTRQIIKPVNTEVLDKFTFEVNIGAKLVHDIVARNIDRLGFDQILAIKELRTLCTISGCTPLGLKDAKEMVEAIYQEREAGNWPVEDAVVPGDDLPF